MWRPAIVLVKSGSDARTAKSNGAKSAFSPAYHCGLGDEMTTASMRRTSVPLVALLSALATLLSTSAMAQSPGPTGLVVLDCAWTPTDGLSDCRVVQETPARLGLGAKALGAMRGFKLVPGHAPMLRDGRLKLGVRVPLPAAPPLS